LTKKFAQQIGYSFTSLSIGSATDFLLVKK